MGSEMCIRDSNSTHFFSDRSEFIEHLYEKHPSSYSSKNFYDQELKMSHFIVFNKLVRNPFMDAAKVAELFKWENRIFDDIKICGCVIAKKESDIPSGAITFSDSTFLQHIRTHILETIPNSSHRYIKAKKAF